MKRFISFIFVALLFASCSTKDDVVDTSKNLEITSEMSLWFNSDGGLGEIEYKITNATTSDRPTATTTNEWITDISVGNSIISFMVNENISSKDRLGEIIVSFNEQSFKISIKQHSIENITTTFYAASLDGSAYFDDPEYDGYNYYLSFSESGKTSDGYLYNDDKYYFFDIYSEIPATGGEYITIPEGEYNFGSGTKPGVINKDYSCLTITYSTTYEDILCTNARLVVSSDMIEGFMWLENGEVHHIVYYGENEFVVPVPGFSTLREDHNFDIEDGVFAGVWLGDWGYYGLNTCQLYLFEYLDEVTGEERGDQFQIDIQLNWDDTDICGTYTAGTTVGCFIPGWAEDVGDGQYLQNNTWYMTAGFEFFAPLVDGTVKIEKDENDIYTFTINCIDDKGYKVAGTFKGKGKFIEY